MLPPYLPTRRKKILASRPVKLAMPVRKPESDVSRGGAASRSTKAAHLARTKAAARPALKVLGRGVALSPIASGRARRRTAC